MLQGDAVPARIDAADTLSGDAVVYGVALTLSP